MQKSIKQLWYSVFSAGYILMFLLLIGHQTLAQKGEEENVAFAYVKGQRVDGKLKVIIIGTHIMGFKGLNKPLYNGEDVKISLGFSDLMKDIELDEYVTGLASQHNISFGYPEVESVTSDIHPSISQKYNITKQDSKLAALEKIRRGLMDEYYSQGYKIYQISFDPTDYNKFEYWSGSWLPYEYIKRSAISSLWIPYYRKGEIKTMLTALGGYDKKNSSASTSTSTGDEERWKQQVAANRYQAAQLESEANWLYNLGSFFYEEALEKYKEAYRLSPTSHSAQRIEYIESMFVLGEGINKLGEGIDNAVYNLDPNESTKFTYSLINYTGLPVGTANPFIDPSVFTGSVGFSMHRIYLSCELYFGYTASPWYEYHVDKEEQINYRAENIRTKETVRVQYSTLGMGWGLGVNIPVKKVLFYGLYGADMMMFRLGAQMRSEHFSLDEIPYQPYFNWKKTIGTIIKIPGTKMAFGAHFNFNKIKGEKEGSSQNIKKSTDPFGSYYFGATTSEEYKFQNLGVRLLFDL